VMSHNDMFLVVALGTLVTTPLAFLLRPLPTGEPVAVH